MDNVPEGTFNLSPAADWLAAAGTFMGRAWSAVRACGGAWHKEPVRAPAKSRRAGAARAAVPWPSPWVEPGELPESYGRTKVVAMVVSPYLIHVYWDLGPKDRAQSGPARLRFHDSTAGDSFDVAIDVAARNWYVHVWSPGKTYSVELGWQRAGAFAPVACSNPVETPRAWPMTEVGQPERPVAGVPDLPPRSAPAPQSLPAPPPVSTKPAGPAPQPAARPQTPTPAVRLNAIETLRRRLSELYGFRRWPRPVALAGPAAPEEAPIPALPDLLADFTGRLETQFSPGLSSVQLGLPGQNKPSG